MKKLYIDNMKHIKKFEELDFTQTIPITTTNFLTNYYSCDECDNIWYEVNKECNVCNSCESTEIEDLPEDEWYELAKIRMNPVDYSKLLKERDINSKTAVDLLSPKIVRN